MFYSNQFLITTQRKKNYQALYPNYDTSLVLGLESWKYNITFKRSDKVVYSSLVVRKHNLSPNLSNPFYQLLTIKIWLSFISINLLLISKCFRIPITFNNPLKVYFSNKKNTITSYNPNRPDTNCKSIFLIEKPGFNGFLKIIGVQI